jgi:sarcosine oxidase subunit beta
MSEKYDAIIIGSGIIGCCIAYELTRRGQKTLNIDKLPTAGYGSTSNSCAIIRLHYSTPAGVATAREGYYYWLDWAKYLGAEDPKGLAIYRNTGCMVVKTEINKQLKKVISALDDMGVGFLELSPEETRRYLPNIDTRAYYPAKTKDTPGFGEPTGDSIGGAIWVSESGYVNDPQLSTHNVQVAAETLGAKFRYNTEVVDILKENGRAAGVKLKDGSSVSAPVVVNVAGPHSFVINRMAGVEAGMKIKTRALKQEVCHVPAPEGVNWVKDGFVLSDGDIGCYSRPEVGNNVLIGSEDPECDVREWVDDPDNYNTGFSDQWTTQNLREAQRIQGLPILNKPQGVVDLYDVSDDWIPIYDKSDLPGFYMAVGTSGNQYKNAPVAADMMAELILACEAGLDHDKQPYQYKMRYLNRNFDMGFYSRLRTINPDSSFSVIG